MITVKASRWWRRLYNRDQFDWEFYCVIAYIIVFAAFLCDLATYAVRYVRWRILEAIR